MASDWTGISPSEYDTNSIWKGPDKLWNAVNEKIGTAENLTPNVCFLSILVSVPAEGLIVPLFIRVLRLCCLDAWGHISTPANLWLW